MQRLDSSYWQNRYINEKTGWDVGEITTPLKTYFEQLFRPDIKILIPGAGNAHEAAWLFQNGFKNVYLLDWAEAPLLNFKKKIPDFPEAQLLQSDFFQHLGDYDLMVEQTFFCAIDPQLRPKYAKHVADLLHKRQGKLVGLLFNREFEKDGPPFGGTKAEYKDYFKPYFDFHVFEECHNSIPPRLGSELFILLKRKKEQDSI